jgi:hypothetical protein
MPLTWEMREPETKIATVVVIGALSWFAAVKEQNHSRRADRGSYVIGLKTDLSCLPLAENAGALNILSRLETATLQNDGFSHCGDGRCDGASHEGSQCCFSETEPTLDAPSGRNRSCTGNRRWSDRRVMFATLDAGRVCTKSGDITPDPDLCAAHEETAVDWMRETFAEAELTGSAAIMFIFLDGWSNSHTALWHSLREELASFRRPVVDVYRNSPPHRADEPFHIARGGPFANLISVVTGAGEVSGGENEQWMKINVDTRFAEVFSFVPAVTAVHANR